MINILKIIGFSFTCLVLGVGVFLFLDLIHKGAQRHDARVEARRFSVTSMGQSYPHLKRAGSYYQTESGGIIKFHAPYVEREE